MRVPLASPNLRPQERSCKAPGFAHQSQKEQKPQRGLFGGEAVRPGCLCQTLPLSQIHLLLSTFLSLPSSPPSLLTWPLLQSCPLKLHTSHGALENLNAISQTFPALREHLF